MLNRAAHAGSGSRPTTSSTVLGREPDVLVPSDREIPRAVNEGNSDHRSPSPQLRGAAHGVPATTCRDTATVGSALETAAGAGSRSRHGIALSGRPESLVA